ncbi:unnamed protein product [Acanthoscelides obtectus]|uniref:Uncharacterized protein n=1 Tax=Acanthoscelides obtectus TaxID=200917 RepID=A0A9P0KUP1_ACAOB|nr:unnamed protein product [Acanthoscelides obtectus]CAK1656094.1 hypothetical protein AOBTE_LOCUS19570 [Acanthoscelides obtectus]
MDEELYNLPSPSNEEQYVHTSSTLSASESDNPAKTAGVQEHMLDKKKSKRKIRYVGDISSEDFSTPKKAKRNFRNLKSALDSEKKKRRGLQTTVTTLRRRIKTLSSLLKLLRSKHYTSGSSKIC